MGIWADAAAGATVSIIAVVTRFPSTLSVADFFVVSTGQALTRHTCACAIAGRVIRDRNLYATTNRIAYRRGARIVVLWADERCARHADSGPITGFLAIAQITIRAA